MEELYRRRKTNLKVKSFDIHIILLLKLKIKKRSCKNNSERDEMSIENRTKREKVETKVKGEPKVKVQALGLLVSVS